LLAAGYALLLPLARLLRLLLPPLLDDPFEHDPLGAIAVRTIGARLD
jgi:hypothetical protein